MSVKSWNVGDVLTASDMNVWTVPIAVIKPSSTSRNTTTSMTADPDLVLPLAASSSYRIVGIICYDGASMSVNTDPGGLKWTFTTPAGSTGQVFFAHQNASGIFTGSYLANWTDTITAATQGTGLSSDLCVDITGVIQVSGTAGNLTMSWAQVNSSGTNTRVKTYSFLEAQRIS